MPYDIFISYRRSDAQVFAKMIYTDLTYRGYNVFYDHNMGGGNFLENILNAIENCNDVIVLLSKDSLSQRIFLKEDIMRKEIAYAISKNKRIVGIMMEGFESFPDMLPEDLSGLPYVNCLSCKFEYYDYMIGKLTSGDFLFSTPYSRNNTSSVDSTVPVLPDDINWFISKPIEVKQNYMRFMLELSDKFNKNESCIRLYEYLDICFRKQGLAAIPKYGGIIPTDFATYLSFFEDLYLLVITETVDISLIDESYRFRFFVACNNQSVQESELLKMGYQYPRIFALYDYWSEYIRKKNINNSTKLSLLDTYPGFERDLIVMYGLYCFSLNQQPTQIRFLNKNFNRKNLTIKRIEKNQFILFSEFQDTVLSKISDNKEKNIFEPLSLEEIEHSVLHDVCVGIFDNEKLVALTSIILSPNPSQDIINDIPNMHCIDTTQKMIIDSILVLDEYRGYGIQRAFLILCDFIAKKHNKKFIGAVVSPNNPYSERNFIKSGYRFVINLQKYHSTRDYFIKEFS